MTESLCSAFAHLADRRRTSEFTVILVDAALVVTQPSRIN